MVVVPASTGTSTPGELHDRLGEAVPAGGAGVRDVQRSRSTPASSAARIAGREIGGERRRQQLVGDDRQRSLLARPGDHPRDEVAALRRAAVEPVQAGGAHHERSGRVRQRGVLAGELGDRVDAARARQSRPRRRARRALPSNT